MSQSDTVPNDEQTPKEVHGARHSWQDSDADRRDGLQAGQGIQTKAETVAFQFETLFMAMTDAVCVYSTTGQIINANPAAYELLALELDPDFSARAPEERLRMLHVRDLEDRPVQSQDWRISRILAGEVFLESDEVRMTALDGRILDLHISSELMRDGQGNVIGAIAVLRNITDRLQLEKRTRKTLTSVMSVAQLLIQATEPLSPASEQATTDRHTMPQQLAELILGITGCQRVVITSVDCQTHQILPVATAGFTPEGEQWLRSAMPNYRYTDFITPEQAEQLRAGEIVILSLTPNDWPDKMANHALVAPLRLGSELIGLISYDYGGAKHAFRSEELELADALTTFVTLALDRERLAQEREETRARALALLEANRRMDNFLSIASHEMRTPITSAKTSVQFALKQLDRLLNEQADPLVMPHIERVRDLLGYTERQFQRQERLINDLLNVSLLQSGKFHLRRAVIDLVSTIRESVEEQRLGLPERVIELSAPVGIVPVFADPDRLGQVITNYLANALKYSDEAKPVRVAIHAHEHTARVSVRDEGPGLPIEEQTRIWERFYRAEDIAPRSGSSVGFGLGLHISYAIIERHGGRCGVESHPGQGSIFWFEIPLLSDEATTHND
ncbi:MAG: hypothetical protein OJF49_000411 [Ktedonobacterales bacterium]|jgi:signal transduction histidine kinase|nr:MAG: hypothetical protein OJF49_000411 [Ktedonobacterales bacterium]